MRSFVLESGGAPRPPPDSFLPLHKAPPSTPRRRHQRRSLTRAFCRLDSRHTKVAGSSSSDSIVAVLFTITGLSEQGVPRGPIWYPQILKDRSILSHPGVADNAHHNTTGPGGFSDLPTALITQTATRYYTSSSTTITTTVCSTKFCSLSTSSYTMAWWREKCRYSVLHCIAKRVKKAFSPRLTVQK